MPEVYFVLGEVSAKQNRIRVVIDGPGDHSASTLVPMPGWTGAPQIVPARIVWRTELGQQLPGEREARPDLIHPRGDMPDDRTCRDPGKDNASA